MILDWATILCVDYILYLRVRALYSLETRCLRVVMCIQVLYLLNVIITLGSLIAVQIGEGAFPHAVPNGSGFCDSRKLLIGLRCLYWSAPLTYNSILMCLAFYKAASIRSSLGFRGANIVRTVVVDQAIYFLLRSTTSLSAGESHADPLEESLREEIGDGGKLRDYNERQ
ncbi:hypothetical protein ACEPAH_2384 [Sanghuangporus vaninii]